MHYCCKSGNAYRRRWHACDCFYAKDQVCESAIHVLQLQPINIPGLWWRNINTFGCNNEVVGVTRGLREVEFGAQFAVKINEVMDAKRVNPQLATNQYGNFWSNGVGVLGGRPDTECIVLNCAELRCTVEIAYVEQLSNCPDRPTQRVCCTTGGRQP